MSVLLVEIVVPMRAYAEDKKQRPFVDKRTGQAKMGPRSDEPRPAAFKREAYARFQQAMRAAGHGAPFSCPLRVLITRYRPRPAAPGVECPDVQFDTFRPDWDNVGKLVGDAGTGVLWEDDKNIVEGTVKKEFADAWGLKITVWRAVA